MLLLRYLLCGLARCVLALRYRLHVDGLDKVRGLKGPVLILPNHPAYIEAAIVLGVLWPSLKPRPLVFDTMFRNLLLRPFAKLLNALRVPDLDSHASAQSHEEAQAAINAVIDGLKKGENFILWPAGRIQRGGVEAIGGARAATEILRAVPEANVVLVRTTGLWGSGIL